MKVHLAAVDDESETAKAARSAAVEAAIGWLLCGASFAGIVDNGTGAGTPLFLGSGVSHSFAVDKSTILAKETAEMELTDDDEIVRAALKMLQ